MSTDPNAIGPLRRRMIEDMTIRRFAEKTQGDDSRHARAFLDRSPDLTEPEDLRRFQRRMPGRDALARVPPRGAEHRRGGAVARLRAGAE